MVVIGFVGKWIAAIPLWVTAKVGRQIVRFFTELIEIGLWRAKWYISIIFWLLFAWVMVSLEPWVKHYGGPIYAAYWRLVTSILLLSVLAYRTARLRRRWRRSKMEIRVLGASERVLGIFPRKSQPSQDNGNGKGTKTNVEELERAIAHNEARGDPVPKEWYNKVAKARQAKQKGGTQTIVEEAPAPPRKTRHVDEPDDSYEATLRQIMADQDAQVVDLLSGKVQGPRKEPWNLGLNQKPKRSRPGRTASKTEPPRKTRLSTQVQRDTIEVGDNLEFDTTFMNGSIGRVIGKVITVLNDPDTGEPNFITRSKDRQEWIIKPDQTIYRHWK